MNKGQRIIGSSVLIFEAIAIWLAIPVAIQNHNIDPAVAISVGSILGLVAGSLLQPIVIATGFWVTPMLFIGGLFALLWAVGLLIVRRADRIRQQRFGS